MTPKTFCPDFAADFPAAAEYNGAALSIRFLKGAPFERLISTTYDSLSIAPAGAASPRRITRSRTAGRRRPGRYWRRSITRTRRSPTRSRCVSSMPAPAAWWFSQTRPAPMVFGLPAVEQAHRALLEGFDFDAERCPRARCLATSRAL